VGRIGIILIHGTKSGYNYHRCRCDLCKKANAEFQADYRARTGREAYLKKMRDWRQKLRKEVLDHYGGVCACCGESQLEFLALDHKNGGGTKHRTELGIRGQAMWSWVKREGFPELFQVLCHNCNQAKGYYGSCPHGKSTEAIGPFYKCA
jgi:hypothetical protein